MDIERLMSPTGGRGYERDITSGVVGFAAMFASGSLFDKLIMRPMDVHLSKVRTRETLRIRGGIPRASANRYGPSGPRRPRASASLHGPPPPPSPNTLMEELKMRQGLRAEAKSIAKGRNLFRLVGAASLASFAFEIGVGMATPGISKVAAESEQKFLAGSGPMDSARSATMRQRSIQAIHDSMMNTRNVIGNEAQFMHR